MKSGWRSDHAIQATAEFKRIEALPSREPTIDPGLVQQLTDLLRTPTGTMSLRPVQALALHDIGITGGLCAPIRVGGGKTLVSLLAPYILEARRPLLLTTASLVRKTEDERRELMRHWRIPRHIRLMSFESLGRQGSAQELERYRPDVIVVDEGHRLKNPRAACTRRVHRYMEQHPETRVIIMSGTLIKHSLRDFGPLCAWALKDGAPVPLEMGELIDWADALDEKVNPLTRVQPGVMGEDITEARAWFQRRFLSTPGVVATPGDNVACSILMRALEYDVLPITEANFTKLREEWKTPDGWTYSLATDIWRCARELALGMHYVWDPRPPDAWLEARRSWASVARDAIKNSMWTDAPLDSELQVVNAVDRGDIDDGGALEEWRRIKPTFQINSKPVWHDDSALKVCADWAQKHHGIIWVEHTFFGQALSRMTGLPYFGAGGLDKEGRSIDKSEQGDRSVIASVHANSTGRNLQMFSENLITSMQPGADGMEQLMGRTHRDGQEADEVTFDVLLGCAEHLDAMAKARQDAQMHFEVLGQPQKLLLADIDWPEETRRSGKRWQKTAD